MVGNQENPGSSIAISGTLNLRRSYVAQHNKRKALSRLNTDAYNSLNKSSASPVKSPLKSVTSHRYGTRAATRNPSPIQDLDREDEKLNDELQKFDRRLEELRASNALRRSMVLSSTAVAATTTTTPSAMKKTATTTTAKVSAPSPSRQQQSKPSPTPKAASASKPVANTTPKSRVSKKQQKSHQVSPPKQQQQLPTLDVGEPSVVKSIINATGQGCKDILAAGTAVGVPRGACWTTRAHKTANLESSATFQLKHRRQADLVLRMAFLDNTSVPKVIKFSHAPTPTAPFEPLGEVKLRPQSTQLRHLFRLGGEAGVQRCLRIEMLGYLSKDDAGMHKVAHILVTGNNLSSSTNGGTDSGTVATMSFGDVGEEKTEVTAPTPTAAIAGDGDDIVSPMVSGTGKAVAASSFSGAPPVAEEEEEKAVVGRPRRATRSNSRRAGSTTRGKQTEKKAKEEEKEVVAVVEKEQQHDEEDREESTAESGNPTAAANVENMDINTTQEADDDEEGGQEQDGEVTQGRNRVLAAAKAFSKLGRAQRLPTPPAASNGSVGRGSVGGGNSVTVGSGFEFDAPDHSSLASPIFPPNNNNNIVRVSTSHFSFDKHVKKPTTRREATVAIEEEEATVAAKDEEDDDDAVRMSLSASVADLVADAQRLIEELKMPSDDNNMDSVNKQDSIVVVEEEDVVEEQRVDDNNMHSSSKVTPRDLYVDLAALRRSRAAGNSPSGGGGKSSSTPLAQLAGRVAKLKSSSIGALGGGGGGDVQLRGSKGKEPATDGPSPFYFAPQAPPPLRVGGQSYSNNNSNNNNGVQKKNRNNVTVGVGAGPSGSNTATAGGGGVYRKSVDLIALTPTFPGIGQSIDLKRAKELIANAEKVRESWQQMQKQGGGGDRSKRASVAAGTGAVGTFSDGNDAMMMMSSPAGGTRTAMHSPASSHFTVYDTPQQRRMAGRGGGGAFSGYADIAEQQGMFDKEEGQKQQQQQREGATTADIIVAPSPGMDATIAAIIAKAGNTPTGPLARGVRDTQARELFDDDAIEELRASKEAATLQQLRAAAAIAEADGNGEDIEDGEIDGVAVVAAKARTLALLEPVVPAPLAMGVERSRLVAEAPAPLFTPTTARESLKWAMMPLRRAPYSPPPKEEMIEEEEEEEMEEEEEEYLETRGHYYGQQQQQEEEEEEGEEEENTDVNMQHNGGNNNLGASWYRMSSNDIPEAGLTLGQFDEDKWREYEEQF